MRQTIKTIPNLWTRWTEIYLYQSEGVTFEDMDAVRGTL